MCFTTNTQDGKYLATVEVADERHRHIGQEAKRRVTKRNHELYLLHLYFNPQWIFATLKICAIQISM